ncbi:hypothetical protein BDW_02340 [Bdellovibrio bacteriovorus W]|nr:hypothetical protein BDW_02340 [Bdellovibrio bacteriovorus W]
MSVFSLIFSIAFLVGYFSCWSYFFKMSSARLPQSMWAIVGVVVPFIGAFLGWYYILAGPREIVEPTILFAELTRAQMVDYVDEKSTASVIASNSEWLKKNWHVLNDVEKQEWVKSRWSSLVEFLPEVKDSPSFINALMKADKNYTRKTSS